MPIAVLVGKVLMAISVAMVARVMLAIGLGFFVFTGVQTFLDFAQAEVVSTINAAVVPQIIVFVGLLRIDDAIAVIFSAFSVRVMMYTVDGVVKKLSFF